MGSYLSMTSTETYEEPASAQAYENTGVLFGPGQIGEPGKMVKKKGL
jgi:hypothetical protein